MVPIAMATSYLPITAGGAGAREIVFASLYGAIGVPPEDAIAASLLLAMTYYVSAAPAGLIPVPGAETSPAEEAP